MRSDKIRYTDNMSTVYLSEYGYITYALYIHIHIYNTVFDQITYTIEMSTVPLWGYGHSPTREIVSELPSEQWMELGPWQPNTPPHTRVLEL